MAISSIPAGAADYSDWLKNISAPGDPEALYAHETVKVAVSGNYVHLAWLGARRPGVGEKAFYSALFYTRSANGGLSFDKPRILAKGLGPFQTVRFPATSNNLAANGAYVHILYINDWIGDTGPAQTLAYLRSTDNGATFAASHFTPSLRDSMNQPSDKKRSPAAETISTSPACSITTRMELQTS